MKDSTKVLVEDLRKVRADLASAKSNMQNLAYMFVQCIEGDMDDPTEAYELMYKLGFVNDAYEWNYEDE